MKLIYPLNSIYVTSPYGGSRNHNGVDFKASVGTPIYAPADGKVISIYDKGRGGKQLILKHSSGYTTGYAHLYGYNVKVGDQVKSGDLIAYTGNTGVGTGPHLHFTVRRYGDSLDPMTVLSYESTQKAVLNTAKKAMSAQNVIALLVLAGIIIYLYKRL